MERWVDHHLFCEVNALLARIKHRGKGMALIGLLTICIEYYEEGLKFDYTDYKAEIDQVL